MFGIGREGGQNQLWSVMGDTLVTIRLRSLVLAFLPSPGSARMVRVRLCLPSAVLDEQEWEHGDHCDQESTTQSPEQATSQATSTGGSSSAHSSPGMRLPAEPRQETQCGFQREFAGTEKHVGGGWVVGWVARGEEIKPAANHL